MDKQRTHLNGIQRIQSRDKNATHTKEFNFMILKLSLRNSGWMDDTLDNCKSVIKWSRGK